MCFSTVLHSYFSKSTTLAYIIIINSLLKSLFFLIKIILSEWMNFVFMEENPKI